jgi:hypothetical protein
VEQTPASSRPGDSPVGDLAAASSADEVTCVIVSISGGAQLERCVAAIAAQSEPPAELIIAAGERTPVGPGSIPADAKVLYSPDNSPVALAAFGLRAATGSIVALTEDTCVADSEWLAALHDAVRDGHSVAGGVVAPPQSDDAFDRAFYLVDFFKYSPQRPTGDADSLSVCNVAYDALALNSVRSEWEDGFHETRVHDLLAKREGLWFTSAAKVTSTRRVSFADGVAERFRFGRLFAAKRFDRVNRLMRVVYAAGSLALPFVLYGRISRTTAGSTQSMRQLLLSSPQIFSLLCAWSLGELAGYGSGRAPQSLAAAPDRDSTNAS